MSFAWPRMTPDCREFAVKFRPNLNTLNWFLAEIFYSAITVDILDQERTPSPNTRRSEIKCRSRLSAIAVEGGFTEAIAATGTVAALRAVLTRYLRVSGNVVAERSIIICD